MADIKTIATQHYAELWDVNYHPSNDGNKQNLARQLFLATKTYNAIAQDLIDLDQASTELTRTRLVNLIRAFFESTLAFYRKNKNGSADATLVQLFDRIHSRMSALAVRLCMLNLDFDTPLPAADPPQGAAPDAHFWKLPNAQAIELLVSATLETLGVNAILGNLADLLSNTNVRAVQVESRTIVDQECGLPFVMFVCMTDRLVTCSGDLWSGFFEFNRNARTRRKARFDNAEINQPIDFNCTLAFNRFEYVREWMSANDPNFAGRANACTLDERRYNRLVEAMYQTSGNPGGAWPPNNQNEKGGNPLDRRFGFNHTSENGRAFNGKGQNMFVPMSRCWKCRFVYHYKVYRPGTQQPSPDGVPVETPKETSWVCNKPFVCAEDLCHYRCWVKNGGMKPGTVVMDLVFKPYPNSPS